MTGPGVTVQYHVEMGLKMGLGQFLNLPSMEAWSAQDLQRTLKIANWQSASVLPLLEPLNAPKDGKKSTNRKMVLNGELEMMPMAFGR